VLHARCQAIEAVRQSEHDREPDPPHGHLGWGWLAGV
jgi:hypothetical protein